MNCKRFLDVAVRALAGEASAEELDLSRAHAARCEACRSEAAGLAAIWRDMGAWEVPPVSDGDEARLLRRVALESGTGRRRAFPPRHRLQLLAAALVGLICGLTVPALAGPEAGDAGPRFLLLLRRGPEAVNPAAGPAFAQMVLEYAAWRADLAERGILESSNLLDSSAGVQLRNEAGRILSADSVGRDIAGAYVSGYYVLTAPNLEAAREIAATSPHLRYGGTIELRPVVPAPGR